MAQDAVAAITVTVLLVPQSLAYALLAGLPAEMGLYASIGPLLLYAAFGSSKTLSVGPVAVASLMTASAIGAVTEAGIADPISAATMLALLGGSMMMALGLMKMGFVANFLSHSVVSGFITASGILIALSQLKHLLGIKLHGDSLPERRIAEFVSIETDFKRIICFIKVKGWMWLEMEGGDILYSLKNGFIKIISSD